MSELNEPYKPIVRDGFLFFKVAQYREYKEDSIDYAALGIAPPKDSHEEIVWRDSIFALDIIDVIMDLPDESSEKRFIVSIGSNNYIGLGMISDFKEDMI